MLPESVVVCGAGMKLANLSKILKCAAGEDIITMKSEDDGDTITFLFESKNQERLSEFDLKLMDIDSEQLGIPDSDYDATVKMPSAEFQRICKICPQLEILFRFLCRRMPSSFLQREILEQQQSCADQINLQTLKISQRLMLPTQ